MIARRAIFGLLAGLPFVGKALATPATELTSSVFANPKFAPTELESGFLLNPFPERWTRMQFYPLGERPPAPLPPRTMFSAGVKTIIEAPYGVKVVPSKVVVIETKQGENVVSFDFSSRHARSLAARLNDYADFIDGHTLNPAQVQ